ncbi:MAG: nucleoside hydrolase [Verrucomicrobiota bacterium]
MTSACLFRNFARAAILALFLCWSLACPAAPSPPPVKIFFDTDMLTDCDDAGAMAVLHALADKGECEILATVVSVPDLNSIATVDVINRYYGRPNLPLGMVRSGGVKQKSLYVGKVAAEFPHAIKSADSVPDAVLVYRDVLERQPDHSVVIVTVGYLTNLKKLLELPAGDGHASGRELVQHKVKQYVCMGGNFIGNPPKDDLKLGNVNFQRDAASAHFVIHHWPGPIVFAGREVCSVPSGLAIGANLAKTPTNNPVRRAYEHYFGGTAKNRHVADLASVLYAVRGPRDYWDVSPPGRMDLRPDITFDWKSAADGNQRYLLKKQRDGKPNDRYVESALDELLLQPPRATAGKKTIPGANGWRHEELKRFKAAEANQGVAVDAEFFYAIDNFAIGKYRKDTGERVAGWHGAKNGPIKHLNSGVVLDGRIYCAHSNYPRVPMESSVEIWDTATMKHVATHRFANAPGSLTWACRRGDEWFACFAHYRTTSDPSLTQVVKMDTQWQTLATGKFPPELIQRFAGNSASGGAFGPGGHLFATGHDAKELYVLTLPDSGPQLKWDATIPISAAGQAFCWDPADASLLYSISRRTKEVIVSRIMRK